MAQYFTGDFADFTTCSGTACGDWTTRYRSGVVWTPANPVTIPNSGTADWTALTWNDVDGDADRDDVELLVLLNTATAGRANYDLIVRGGGADETAAHYSFRLAATTVAIMWCNGSDPPTLVASNSKTLAASTDYWVRFRVNGTTTQLRVWLDGDLEPGTWDVDTTDTNGPSVAGWVGMAGYSTSTGGVIVKQFGVGTNGDSAPASAPSSSLNIDASAISISGALTASGDIAIGVGLNLSASPVSVSGALSATGDLAYYVPMLDVSAGTLAITGTVAASGNLGVGINLSASPIAVTGVLSASGDVQIGTDFALSANTLSLSGALTASGDIEITEEILLDINASALSVSGSASVSGDIEIAEPITLDLSCSPIALTGSADVAGDLGIGTSFNLSVDPIIVAGAVSASGDILASTAAPGASAAEIWGYTLSNGDTAEANVVEIRAMLRELYRIHGLQVGVPLVVEQTSRAAGAIIQTIEEVAGTVTVTRT